MKIEIKKLMPDMASEYIEFFDTTPHDDGIPEHTCYCVNWCAENQRDRAKDIPRDERRRLARKYIENGTLQGYIATVEGRMVAWCNANTKGKCLDCFGWYYFMTEINELPVEGEKIKSIFCFVVAPDMKRKGIATKLLDFICEDSKNDGYDYVEAYPMKDESDEFMFYVGHSGLYEKLGFEVFAETDTKRVLRKKL